MPKRKQGTQKKLFLQEEIMFIAVLTSNREEIRWKGKGTVI